MKIISVLFFALGFLIYYSYSRYCSDVPITNQISDHLVQIDNLNTFYRTAGNPENKTLVFIPGWAARNSGKCIKGNDLVIDELAKYFYVVMYEPPGLMRSQPPEFIWSFDDYANHLHSLLESLKIEKPIMMGQSFGGGISTAYAKHYPNDTNILILVDSTFANRERNWYYNLRFPWNYFVKQTLTSNLAPFSLKKLLVSGYFGVPLEKINSDNVRNWVIVAEIQQAYDLEVEYSSLKMPVIMVWGAEDTYVTPIKQAKMIQQEITNSKFIEIDGGHTILFNKPKEVIQKILLEL